MKSPTKPRLLVPLLALSALLSSTAGQAAEPAGGADLIVHGGSILTMDGDKPTYADAVVVDKGKILFVGSDA